MTRRLSYILAVIAAAALVSWLMQPRAAPDDQAADEPREPAQAPSSAQSPSSAAEPGDAKRPSAAIEPRAAVAPSQPAQVQTYGPPGDRDAQQNALAPAPGQALREVQQLVNENKIGAARALAERYLREIPDGPEASQIKSLTGVHPHP